MQNLNRENDLQVDENKRLNMTYKVVKKSNTIVDIIEDFFLKDYNFVQLSLVDGRSIGIFAQDVLLGELKSAGISSSVEEDLRFSIENEYIQGSILKTKLSFSKPFLVLRNAKILKKSYYSEVENMEISGDVEDLVVNTNSIIQAQPFKYRFFDGKDIVIVDSESANRYEKIRDLL